MAITLPNESCPIHDVTEQVRDVFSNAGHPEDSNITEETNLAAFTTIEEVLEVVLDELGKTSTRIHRAVNHEPVPANILAGLNKLTPLEALEAGMKIGAMGLNLRIGRSLIEVQSRFRNGLTKNTIAHLEENGDGGAYIEDENKSSGVHQGAQAQSPKTSR